MRVLALPPQCLCSGPLPQSSPAVPEFCPPCRPSCRSSEAEPRRRRSSWRTPQTWPGTARRSARGTTETPDSPSQESGDSLRARTCGGGRRNRAVSQRGLQKTLPPSTTHLCVAVLLLGEATPRRASTCIITAWWPPLPTSEDVQKQRE